MPARRDAAGNRREFPKEDECGQNDKSPCHPFLCGLDVLCQVCHLSVTGPCASSELAHGALLGFGCASEVQIVVPTTLVPGLLRALTTRKELYEKTFGVQLKRLRCSMNSTAQSTVLTTATNSSTTIGKGITSIPNKTTRGAPYTVPVPVGGSRAQRPDKKLEAAVGHIRA